MRRIESLDIEDSFWVIDTERKIHKAIIKYKIVGPQGYYFDTDVGGCPTFIHIPEKFVKKSLFRCIKTEEQFVVVSDEHFLKFRKYIHEKVQRS